MQFVRSSSIYKRTINIDYAQKWFSHFWHAKNLFIFIIYVLLYILHK